MKKRGILQLIYNNISGGERISINKEIVLQDGIKDCGICCLLSVVKHYGGNISKEYLRELTSTNKNGVVASKLVETALFLGFDSYGLSGKITDLKKEQLPIIAHVILNKSYKHFIVIYDINYLEKKIIVMDPARGKRIMKFSEFNLLTSGNFIYLKPLKPIANFSSKKVIKTAIIEFIKKHISWLIILFILSFTSFVLNILSCFHLKYLMNYALEYNSLDNALTISIVLLLIFILKEISSLLKNITLIKWSELFDEALTMKTFRQIISLPYLYYKNRTTGEVVSRIRDLSETKNFLTKLFCFLSTDLLCIIVFIILLLDLNKKMTLWVLLIISSLFIFSLITKKYLKKKIIKYHKKEMKLNSYLIEVLSSNSVIKGEHVESNVIYKFRKKYQSLLEAVYKLSIVKELEEFIKNIIINVGWVIILFLGCSFIIKEKLSIGDLIVFQSVLSYYFASFKNLLELYYDYSNFKLTFTRVEDLFSIKKENFIGSRHYINYKLNGPIKYKNLNYKYSSKQIFNKINLEIKAGEKIFFYGPTGSGKSTLMKLLMRYIEVPFGKLSINDIDINHYHLDVLRNRITYVSQNEYLFTDTILENITLGRVVNEEKLKAICKITKVEEFVSKLDSKFNTLVEENGFNFSGGERQRIILARSLLKNSDIYIFDESLSQVDSKKELEILKDIFKILKGKTIIFISHSKKNKYIFDRKIYLKNGRCYEEKVRS